MIDFFIILLFGKAFLLTPAGIDIDERTEISLSRSPITAINDGAHLQVQIPDAVVSNTTVIGDRTALLEHIFPSHPMRADLIDENGKKVAMDVQSLSIGQDDSRISLSADSGVPVRTKFISIVIYSRIRIKGANVYWKNYGQ